MSALPDLLYCGLNADRTSSEGAMTMRTTSDLTRFPERALGMIPALLTALIIGGAGGYFVKSLSISGPLTVNAPASVEPAIQSSSGDAMDRALAKTLASPLSADAMDRALAKLHASPVAP